MLGGIDVIPIRFTHSNASDPSHIEVNTNVNATNICSVVLIHEAPHWRWQAFDDGSAFGGIVKINLHVTYLLYPKLQRCTKCASAVNTI